METDCGNALSVKETSLSGETNVQSWCSLASTVRHIRCQQFIIFFRPTASKMIIDPIVKCLSSDLWLSFTVDTTVG